MIMLRRRWIPLTMWSLCMAVALLPLGVADAKGKAAHDMQGGTATVVLPSFESLDPQVGFSTINGEAEWNVYTPLLTVAHANGVAGTQVIPGLAIGLPKVTNRGKTYTLKLRKGLRFSNGQAVKASDFAFTVERALKLNWGGDSFLISDIKGALAYQSGKASSVSGITTNNATGRITIRLIQADSAFADILTFTGLGLVPSTTPMTAESTKLPAGVGAYVIKNVVPNQSFTLVKNPRFARFDLPGIPVGHLNEIQASVDTNPLTAEQDVLNNRIDVLDPNFAISPSLISTLQTQASGRYRSVPTEGVQYIFFNTKIAPFNHKSARVAVTEAFDRGAITRIEAGFLRPGCFVLPEEFPGRSTQPCPYGKVSAAPQVAKARALIQAAHLTGSPVTVWTQAASPYDAMGAYYVSVLDGIGFKATLKTISPAIYYPTTANPTLNIQTGLAAYYADYPDPTTFYHLLDARSITPTFSPNRDQLDDPKVQATLMRLGGQSLTPSVIAQWQKLDEYVAKQAYWLVMGYPKDPELFSNRIDVKETIFNQKYLSDWSSWQLVRR